MTEPVIDGDVFVVADVHGNVDALAGLLQQEGLVNADLDREQPDVTVVQIGDLCNCVASSIPDDLRCLDVVEQWLDVYLIGNHEHPYFGGPAFSGFYRDVVIGHRLRLLDSLGVIKPCVAVGGVLVSHAGVTADWDESELKNAGNTAVVFNQIWAEDKTSHVFSRIGYRRGGPALTKGGILWSDWSEPKSTLFSQVVGHTVGDDIRWDRWDSHGLRPNWFAVCIDLGAKEPGSRLAGAWIRDGQVETVVYDPTQTVAA